MQPVQVLLANLKACSTTRDLEWGKQLHEEAVESGHISNTYIANTLINMYSKCGSMLDARLMFSTIRRPDVVSWTALILGYAENGEAREALALFLRMRAQPDSVTFVAALKACISLAEQQESTMCRQRARALQNLAVQNDCYSNIYVQNTLVDVFSKCGCMVDAHRVFDCITNPDVVSWSALVLGYAANGQGLRALQLFRRMKARGSVPNPVTFVAASEACSSLAAEHGGLKCRDRAQGIHNLVMENGCDSDIYVQNALINMYAKCGCTVESHRVFDSMSNPDVVSWTGLVLGYADNGQAITALELFLRMKNEGPAANSLTFMAALKACALVGALKFGRKIHAEIHPREVTDVLMVNCLVDFYAKCGSLVEARRVFDQHSKTRDAVTWSALLAGFSSCGDVNSVLRLLQEMQESGFQPDSVTFLSVLTCCSHAGLVEKGKACFDEMVSKRGISPGIKHYNCMVDMFGRANRLDDAMALLQRMACCPDNVTWKTVLGACRRRKNVAIGTLALQSLMEFGDRDAGYVLMGQIYGPQDKKRSGLGTRVLAFEI